MNTIHRYILLLACGSMLAGSCKKFVEIEAPRSTVSTEAIFTDSTSASAALLGIYSKWGAGSGFGTLPNFGDGAVTNYSGQSADELLFNSTGDQTFVQNALLNTNGTVQIMWKDAYSFIYQANACIEGLDASKTLDAVNKTRFLAEAKFIRAYLYFYLVNLWGDVPYVTSADWTQTFGSGRTAVATVYNNIVQDLLVAQSDLPSAYPTAGKIRPIRLAATAMLARVYLYQKDWAHAQESAGTVINSGLYPKLPAAGDAFLKNNDEAIWQVLPANIAYNTLDGLQFIPANPTLTTLPTYTLQPTLVSSFEPNDLRFSNWMKPLPTTPVSYYPYKYKVRTTVGGVQTEYYTMLRLAEQYLVRAEARAHQNDVPGAVADLNVVRKRAGLPDLSTSLTQDQCYLAVEKERRTELFCEWGHRWLDLKRTGRADAVLAPIKPKWVSTAVLYPIPNTELAVDPSLTQNEGYK